MTQSDSSGGGWLRPGMLRRGSVEIPLDKVRRVALDEVRIPVVTFTFRDGRTKTYEGSTAEVFIRQLEQEKPPGLEPFPPPWTRTHERGTRPSDSSARRVYQRPTQVWDLGRGE